MITADSAENTVCHSQGNETSPSFIVLGGGLAGLASAYELLRRGYRVTVIEKGDEVGGLARTFEAEGFRFDIGGHRFHSNNPTVVQWLKDLLKTNLLVVPRISHIFLNNKFVDYPIQFPGALAVFSPFKAVRMVVSYLMARLMERHRPDVSFEDWVVKRYGKALYETFFQPYTEKVWGIPCDRLSASWASQRIGIPSLLKVIKQAIAPAPNTPATAISQFYYPRAGFGMIPQTLEQEIVQRGGLIYTSTNLMECKPLDQGFKVTIQQQGGLPQTLHADQVISSIPLNALLKTIPAQLGSQDILNRYKLEYRDIVCLFIALKRQQVSTDSWTYFPLKNLVFGRTHEPKNWSAEMVPSDDYTSLAVEIFSSRNEAVWNMSDDEILQTVVQQMDKIGWIQQSDVHRSWVIRVPYAYPVYHIGYREQLKAVKDYLGQWQHLHLVGRTGSFSYMNSDGVIEDVFRLMEELFPEQGTRVKPLATNAGRWM